MDDIVESTDNLELAMTTTQQIDELIKYGGFQIKLWTYATTDEQCNIQELASNHDSRTSGSEEAGYHVPHVKERSNEQKVLGLQWNAKDDDFKVELNFTPKIRKSRSGPNLTRDQMSIPQN